MKNHLNKKLRRTALLVALSAAAFLAPFSADAQSRKPVRSQSAKVVIGDYGYNPASIRLKRGVPAKVTFLRVTESTCATEVVIPEYGISRELPLNTAVTVRFTPRKAGEFVFTCGMNMHRGKLIVSNEVSLAPVNAAIFTSVALVSAPPFTSAQLPAANTAQSHAKYLNERDGRSVDDLVTAALANNLDVLAMRKEAEAGEALIRQARLRANPSLEVSGARQIGGMGDNSVMVQGELPLELGGRRSARINVAEKELEIRRQSLAEQERQLAAEVRAKFGDALAAIFKLKFSEEILATAEQNVQLVSARVAEGRTPPLEENQEIVELNRIRAVRETNEGAVEIRLFELRNLVGMGPEEPFVLKGDLNTLTRTLPPQISAEQAAIRSRPDLLGALAVEKLAGARVGQARSEGRIDADAMVGYQRMQSGFPLLGVDEMSGALLPIEQRMNFFTFGVRLNLPVRDRNQGVVAASLLEEQAARNRRQFGELTVRREVAVAYARYNRAFRAMEIYRVGVRDRAAANAEVVRQTYELGSKTLLDYIAEHHRYIDTENGFIDAQLETYLAMVDILKATNDVALR